MDEETDQTIYQIQERADETAIESEIRGAFFDKMVYSFQQGGKEVVGLSYVGIKEVARRHGYIEISDVEILETDTHFRVICKATDMITHLKMPGVSSQPKLMKLRDGQQVPDEFALQKCVSKATRNAIRAVIPEHYIITCIEEFRKKGSISNPLRPEGQR